MANPLAGLPPRLLRTQEAARFLGISIRTLEKHRTYGTGPTYRKVGGRVLYAVGDLEAWTKVGYRVARKHAGSQPDGWAFEVSHLHHKSGSLARPSDFALDLRRIAARQQLPGYHVRTFWKDGRELLQMRPQNPSTVPVDNGVETLVTSGANSIGTSGANFVAHSIEESNLESNSTALARGHTRYGAGAARRDAR